MLLRLDPTTLAVTDTLPLSGADVPLRLLAGSHETLVSHAWLAETLDRIDAGTVQRGCRCRRSPSWSGCGMESPFIPTTGQIYGLSPAANTLVALDAAGTLHTRLPLRLGVGEVPLRPRPHPLVLHPDGTALYLPATPPEGAALLVLDPHAPRPADDDSPDRAGRGAHRRPRGGAADPHPGDGLSHRAPGPLDAPAPGAAAAGSGQTERHHRRPGAAIPFRPRSPTGGWTCGSRRRWVGRWRTV